MLFANRVEAGRRLAAKLVHLHGMPVVVLGLPRGGVPVAAEVTRALVAPLDVIVVRKLGVPFQPELAMGAIGEGGARVVNKEVVRLSQVSDRALSAGQHASGPSWIVAPDVFAAIDHNSRSLAGSSSWWTTGSRPARQREQRVGSPARPRRGTGRARRTRRSSGLDGEISS